MRKALPCSHIKLPFQMFHLQAIFLLYIGDLIFLLFYTYSEKRCVYAQLKKTEIKKPTVKKRTRNKMKKMSCTVFCVLTEMRNIYGDAFICGDGWSIIDLIYIFVS